MSRKWFLQLWLCGDIDLSMNHIKCHWSNQGSDWNIQGKNMVLQLHRSKTPSRVINSHALLLVSHKLFLYVLRLICFNSEEHRHMSLVFVVVVSNKLAKADIILTSFNWSLLVVCLLYCIHLVAQSLGAVVFAVWS